MNMFSNNKDALLDNLSVGSDGSAGESANSSASPLAVLQVENSYISTIAALAIPASAEVFLQTLFVFVDSIIVAGLGDFQLGGVNLASKILALVLIIFESIGIGASIVISQYHGQSDEEKISRASLNIILFGFIFSLIPTFLFYLFKNYLFSSFGASESLLTYTTLYFDIAVFIIPLNMVYVICACILRATGDAKTPLILSLIALFLNTATTYLLTYGVGSLTGLGVEGAAYATLFSKCLAVVAILITLAKRNYLNIKEGAHLFERETFKFLYELVKITIPVGLGETILSTTEFAYIYLLTNVSETTLISFQMTSTMETSLIMLTYGLGVAGLNLSGNEIGRGSIDNLLKLCQTIIKFSLAASLILLPLYILISNNYFLSLVFPKVDGEIIKLAGIFLIYFGFLQPARVLNITFGYGILKSDGDTGFVLYIDALTCLVGILSAYICVNFMGVGYIGIIVRLFVDQYLRSIIFYIKYSSRTWIKTISTSEVV